MKEHWKNLLAALLLPAALGLSLAGCSADSRADETTDEEAAKAAEAVPVEVAPLAHGEIEAVLRFSTNLEAESAVEVYSEAARRVVDLRVEEGNRVAKGQVLVRLQDDEQKTSLARVEMQLARARREYQRQQRLYAQELISEQAFNDATFELEQLELAEEEARRQLSYTEVRAPIAGTVTARRVNLGDHVTVNQHLFDIVDFDSIVARVYVPEKELPRLAPGLPARITAPALGRETYTGRVDRLAPVVDPKSGTVKVTVALPDAGRLRPGMYVDVVLVTDQVDDALLVPKRALVYDNDQVFVYRLTGDERVERVRLRPVLEDQNFVQPAGGLAAGERVVVAGQAGLKDGARVRVLSAAALPGGAAGAPAVEAGE